MIYQLLENIFSDDNNNSKESLTKDVKDKVVTTDEVDGKYPHGEADPNKDHMDMEDTSKKDLTKEVKDKVVATDKTPMEGLTQTKTTWKGRIPARRTQLMVMRNPDSNSHSDSN